MGLARAALRRVQVCAEVQQRFREHMRRVRGDWELPTDKDPFKVWFWWSLGHGVKFRANVTPIVEVLAFVLTSDEALRGAVGLR